MSAETTPAFTVLVLGGGQSSRMGRDKALLQLQGQTLLQRCEDLGTALGAEHVLISRNQAGFIADEVKDAGPMAGIAAALPHCRSRWLLVLPVDMPLLTPAALAPLLQQAVLHQHGGYFAGFPLPVLLEVSTALRQLLAKQLAEPGASRALYQAWQQLGLVQLPMQTPAAFQNCNDPASFAHIETQLPTSRSFL